MSEANVMREGNLPLSHSCGPDRIRTGDLSHAMRALCQLSYKPGKIVYRIFASNSGFCKLVLGRTGG